MFALVAIAFDNGNTLSATRCVYVYSLYTINTCSYLSHSMYLHINILHLSTIFGFCFNIRYRLKKKRYFYLSLVCGLRNQPKLNMRSILHQKLGLSILKKSTIFFVYNKRSLVKCLT